ncbi:MAG TPA: FecR family protein, partial [bacterium]|nr:FecR family protein [bacterium]
MKSPLRAVVFLITCFFIVGAAWAAATDAVFLSVSGKVSVKDTGGKSRTAKTNSTAAEGETVQVEKGGEATLVFFDGSTLDAKSNTQFILSALQKPSTNEKKLRFNLDFGALMARVQKLMTASSQFEIQAGGIVCGVRGTEFSVVYDPTMGSVDLKVIEGSVYAKTGGIITTVPAGQERKFLNG